MEDESKKLQNECGRVDKGSKERPNNKQMDD